MFKIEAKDSSKEPLRYEHFQTDQNVYIQKIMNRIKSSWVGNIREIVDKEIKKGTVAWFNVGEISREAYEQTKCRKYFKRVKLMMEDNLLSLCQKSFANFCNYVKSYIPERV